MSTFFCKFPQGSILPVRSGVHVSRRSRCLGLSWGSHRRQDPLSLWSRGDALLARLGLLEQGIDQGAKAPSSSWKQPTSRTAPHLPEAPLQAIGHANPLPMAHREPEVGPAGLQGSLETFYCRGEVLPRGPLIGSTPTLK